MRHIYVLHHSPCPDGFSAAWAAYRKLGTEGVTYIGLPAGTTHVPDFKSKSLILMLDLSYPKDILLRLAAEHELIVLDHHKTFGEILAEMTEEERSSFIAHYDTNRSGATLAWNYFHGKAPIPTLLLYVEDHDLWKHELMYSREVAAAIASHPQTFSSWDYLAKENIETLIEQGATILRYQDRMVEYLTNTASKIQFFDPAKGETVVAPAVNSPSMIASQVCHRLLAKYPEAPFVAAYSIQGDGSIKWSLRSRNGSNVDVSRIAAVAGGGGHKHAAGFTVPPVGGDLTYVPEVS